MSITELQDIESSFSYLLVSILMTPLIGAMVVVCIGSDRINWIKGISLVTSLMTFIQSLFVWIGFDLSTAKFQYVTEISWIPNTNMNIYLGVDGISLFFCGIDNIFSTDMFIGRLGKYKVVYKGVLHSIFSVRDMYAISFLYIRFGIILCFF